MQHNPLLAQQSVSHLSFALPGGLYAAVCSSAGGSLHRAELVCLPTKIFRLYTVRFIDIGETGSVKM